MSVTLRTRVTAIPVAGLQPAAQHVEGHREAHVPDVRIPLGGQPADDLRLRRQAPPHLGHVRFAVAFDVLRRWMARGHGLDVTLIRNVTDIDDKILAKSAENGEPWYAVSYRNEVETAAALEALGVLPPTYEPRATGHVPEMVTLMETLVARGHAYPARDGSGDVYFDVRSWPAYGELTHQKVDDMVDAEDADPRGKRDPRDFALWKGRKESNHHRLVADALRCRAPRWHLECSAMARKYLGDTFDIHGGVATCASRTTRTRWRSRGRPASASPTTGCTTPG